MLVATMSYAVTLVYHEGVYWFLLDIIFTSYEAEIKSLKIVHIIHLTNYIVFIIYIIASAVNH